VKVGHLLHMLAEYPRNAEVRFVTRSPWPVEHGVAGVVSKAEIEAFLGPRDEDEAPLAPGAESVYVLESRSYGIGRHAAWVAMESYR